MRPSYRLKFALFVNIPLTSAITFHPLFSSYLGYVNENSASLLMTFRLASILCFG